MIVTKPLYIWNFQTLSINVWVMVAILSPADKTTLTKSRSWIFKLFQSGRGILMPQDYLMKPLEKLSMLGCISSFSCTFLVFINIYRNHLLLYHYVKWCQSQDWDVENHEYRYYSHFCVDKQNCMADLSTCCHVLSTKSVPFEACSKMEFGRVTNSKCMAVW